VPYPVSYRFIPLMFVGSHRLSDGVIETTVERVEFVGCDREILIIRQLRDALADASSDERLRSNVPFV
jgi:hypothetical protein